VIAALPLVVFSHQQHWYGVEACRVRARGAVAAIRPGQSIIPLTSLLPATPDTLPVPACREWLRLSGDQGDWLLGLSGEVDLLELPAACISPLPMLLQQRRLFSPITALALHQGRLITLLDARRLSALVTKPDLGQ
jgi:hypothetical protein